MTNQLQTYTNALLSEAQQGVPNLVVSDPKSEKMAANAYAKCDLILREIEAKRLEVSEPLNEALKARNGEAKEASKPWEELKELLSGKLGGYVASPEQQRAIEIRNYAEKQLEKAVNAGDMESAKLFQVDYHEALEARPKSIETETKATVQYRSSIEIEEITDIPDIFCQKSIDCKALLEAVEFGEVKLPERFILKVPDEKAIKEAIRSGDVPRGVKYHLSVKPVAVVRNSR